MHGLEAAISLCRAGLRGDGLEPGRLQQTARRPQASGHERQADGPCDVHGAQNSETKLL